MAVSWWPCFIMMTSQTVRKTGRPRSRAQHDCTKATTCIPAVLLWVLMKGSWHSGGLPYSLPSWTQAHPSTEILPDQPPLYFSFWHFSPCVFSMGFCLSLPGEHKLQGLLSVLSISGPSEPSTQQALHEYFFSEWNSLALIFNFDYSSLLLRVWPQEQCQPGFKHLSWCSELALWTELC